MYIPHWKFHHMEIVGYLILHEFSLVSNLLLNKALPEIFLPKVCWIYHNDKYNLKKKWTRPYHLCTQIYWTDHRYPSLMITTSDDHVNHSWVQYQACRWQPTAAKPITTEAPKSHVKTTPSRVHSLGIYLNSWLCLFQDTTTWNWHNHTTCIIGTWQCQVPILQLDGVKLEVKFLAQGNNSSNLTEYWTIYRDPSQHSTMRQATTAFTYALFSVKINHHDAQHNYALYQ